MQGHYKAQGPLSQNVLSQVHTIFVTLGPNILKFLRLKSVFEANIIRRGCYLQ
jgi:hypothetical protein